jgi:single-stranded-DNA-specific exonuclease
MTEIISREISPAVLQTLLDHGCPPTLARILAARDISDSAQLDYSLSKLLPFNSLKNAREMASLLANAISAQNKIMVIADYDADGATACAVAVRGLSSFGAKVDFIVPNRFEYGYGLTPEIVQLAASAKPDILLTVDNGIASIAGVAEANHLGMQVFITDHHLPGDTLPNATCIVNPNQPNCSFPSKNLAGVGVMFYVLIALRAELRSKGLISVTAERKLPELLDLVALGTVADVVKLDHNNRILVQQGLLRIRAGRACTGIKALLEVTRKDSRKVSCQDLGFTIGPRLNAAGRLDDMRMGIDCLLTDDAGIASKIALELDSFNRERRNIETDMQEEALALLEHIDPKDNFSLTLFDERWHQGVIGILASRLKDKYHRPTIIFAKSSNGEIKGSGRSIHGLHIRDALDLVSKRHSSLINKFGGHAAAAGLSIDETDFINFVAAFEKVSSELISSSELDHRIETDGALNQDELNLEVVRMINDHVWGQGFPPPQFNDYFMVKNQRIVGEKHLKLRLLKEGKLVEAILFGHNEMLPERIHAVYSVSINDYKNKESLQLIIRHWSALKI